MRATFLWDGRVRGTWQTELKRKTAVLRMAAFETLPREAVSALREEGEELLRFLEPDAAAVDVRVEDA
nr:hypothetical protein GCM10020093_029230 [Planobispora longispora]